MSTNDLIAIRQFCEYYDVPVSFIDALYEFELIDLVSREETTYIRKEHIKSIEKMMRIHYELDVNLEGVDVIYNLLNQIKELQREIVTLNNQLKFYKDA